MIKIDDKVIKCILIGFEGYTVYKEYKFLISNRSIIKLNNVYFEVEKAFVKRGIIKVITQIIINITL